MVKTISLALIENVYKTLGVVHRAAVSEISRGSYGVF